MSVHTDLARSLSLLPNPSKNASPVPNYPQISLHNFGQSQLQNFSQSTTQLKAFQNNGMYKKGADTSSSEEDEDEEEEEEQIQEIVYTKQNKLKPSKASKPDSNKPSFTLDINSYLNPSQSMSANSRQNQQSSQQQQQQNSLLRTFQNSIASNAQKNQSSNESPGLKSLQIQPSSQNIQATLTAEMKKLSTMCENMTTKLTESQQQSTLETRAYIESTAHMVKELDRKFDILCEIVVGWINGQNNNNGQNQNIMLNNHVEEDQTMNPMVNEEIPAQEIAPSTHKSKKSRHNRTFSRNMQVESGEVEQEVAVEDVATDANQISN